jgi:hypothetical protein
MAVTGERHAVKKPLIGSGVYALMAYWALCFIVYFIIDLCLDLYADNDYAAVAWYAGLAALPLAIYTLYISGRSLFEQWYTYLIYPLLTGGIYFASAYFTALNLDLLTSACFKPTTELVLPVQNVQRVVARKAGFIHTNVLLRYQQKTVKFKGTRTSYFLLKPYKQLNVKLGQSYLGSYYITHIQVPNNQRWAARGAYLKDWFKRSVWVLIIVFLVFAFSLLKDRYFPASYTVKKSAVNPYTKYFKQLIIITTSIFGLFIIVLLLIGLFG